MKKIFLLILVLLVSCGEAERFKAPKEIISYDAPRPLTASGELNPYVREVILLSFPNENEVDDFSFTRKHKLWDEEQWNSVFNNVPVGQHYKDQILENDPNDAKVLSLIQKIKTISDSRDEAFKNNHQAKLELKTLLAPLNDEFSSLKCFRVRDRKNPNKGKCYLKSLSRVTVRRGTKISFRSCKDLLMFAAYKKDIKVEGLEEEYLLEQKAQKNLLTKHKTCLAMEEEINRNTNIRGFGKIIVATMLGQAETALGAESKFMAKAQTEVDSDVDGTKESIIEIDLTSKTFKTFQLAINFYDGQGTIEYSPKKGNMTEPVIRNINQSGFYVVDFILHAKTFDLVTNGGLSLSVDPILGVRLIGKIKLKFDDGLVRDGILRIDVGYLE